MFPFRCDSHLAFWREVLGKAGHVAAITTNYDILIERGLRHRRMTRVFGPGCYYGGFRNRNYCGEPNCHGLIRVITSNWKGQFLSTSYMVR